MIDEAKATKLQQDEDMAYFRAGLCLYSPESYTLDEKREICNDMIRTCRAQLDAMREDFETLPPEARSRLLDMLCQSGVESPQWWRDASSVKQTCPLARLQREGASVERAFVLAKLQLVGEGDPLYSELAEI